MSIIQENSSVVKKLNKKKLKIVSATALAAFLVSSPLVPLFASGKGGDDEMDQALNLSIKSKVHQVKKKESEETSYKELGSLVQLQNIQVPTIESLAHLYASAQLVAQPGQAEMVNELIKSTAEANASALKARLLVVAMGGIAV